MYLGIDLGTSSLKLLLLNTQHQVLASESEPLQLTRPHAQWSEQAPQHWWQALDVAMSRLGQSLLISHPHALAAVRAIGLSGQMHGAVLLGADQAVLRPAILWNDGRSGPQCVQLEAALPQLQAISGNRAMPGFTAPKLMWVREHEPRIFAQTRLVLLPKDWLRLQLTGEAVSEMSDASGTLWLDVGRRCWSTELLAACGLDEGQMPRLVEGDQVSGNLLPALAQRWGLRPGIKVAGGAGDNAASAVGIGAVQPQQGLISLGTSGVIFLASDRFQPKPADGVHAFCHALGGRWHQMSVMLSAASALHWACGLLGVASEAQLIDQAAHLTPGQRAAAPLFLPYLAGERTPHKNPDAQGVLFGLTHAHGAADVGYAVLEGVSLGLLDGWRSLQADAAAVGVLSVVGGGARSPWWLQLLADTLALPLVTHAGGEAGAALGAARLAWLADGGSMADVCTTPPVAQRFEPQAQEATVLAERGERFRALYGALRPHFPTPSA